MRLSKENGLRGFRSLKLALLSSLLVGLGFAILIFLGIRMGGNAAINNYYLSEERKKERIDQYIAELQEYIDTNDLTADDTDKLAKWAKDNRYLYVLIYKDEQLLFESGGYGDGKEEQPGTEALPDDEGQGSQEGADDSTDNKTDDKDPDNKYPDTGGLTVQVPTREDLIKYAEERGFDPITMGEANLLVSMADFSEYFYYDVANITAIVSAMIVLILIIMLYFHRVTARITRLGKDVAVVADGNMQHTINRDGSDEIGKLSRDVEQMRSSLVDSIAKEREAMEANTQLITSMSHDIRTPLTVLLGYLDIMKKHTADQSMQEYIKASENTALKLKNLSDDMFNYFLVFGGDFGTGEFKEYDVVTLFDQLLSEHMFLLQERGYEIVFDYGGLVGGDFDNLRISTDPTKLTRIVENVFSNIYKYADKCAPVSIFVNKNNNKIKLKFTNKITKSSDEVESNGIGLKTCHRLAELVGASFLTEKKGEEFSVTMEFGLSCGTQDKD